MGFYVFKTPREKEGNMMAMRIKKTIEETMDYDMFVLNPINRTVNFDKIKTKQLEHIMREKGWSDAEPMNVDEIDGKLIVKNGHHRLEIARKLGIPAKYVIANDGLTIFDLQKGGHPTWNAEDYLGCYCRQGVEDYIVLRDYVSETGIGISQSALLLSGLVAKDRGTDRSFQNGKWKVNKKSNHAEVVRDVIKHLGANGIKFATNYHLVGAISRVCLAEGFSLTRLKQKITTYKSFFEKKATMDQYLDMLEELYNRGSKERIPLAFLANQAARDRRKKK